jgi:hypothetical protein
VPHLSPRRKRERQRGVCSPCPSGFESLSVVVPKSGRKSATGSAVTHEMMCGRRFVAARRARRAAPPRRCRQKQIMREAHGERRSGREAESARPRRHAPRLLVAGAGGHASGAARLSGGRGRFPNSRLGASFISRGRIAQGPNHRTLALGIWLETGRKLYFSYLLIERVNENP